MTATEEIHSLMERHGITGAELARISGKAPATCSQILNGKYQGRPETAAEILESLRARVAAVPEKTTSWATEGQVRMQSLLAFTYEDREFSVLTGPSGIGKTHVLTTFARVNPGCLYVRCAEGMSAGDVASILCQAVDLGASGTILTRLRRCIEAMLARGIQLVLVDEADLLVGDESNTHKILKKLSFFREIHEAGIGVALVGLESFEDALRRTGETYVMSRIGYFRKTKGVTPEELSQFWQQGLGLALDDAAKQALHLAPKAGFFRFLKKLANRARLLDGDVRGAMLLLFGSATHIKEV